MICILVVTFMKASKVGVILRWSFPRKVLNLVLKHPLWRALEVLLNIEDWDLPGIFTTVFPCVKRYSNLIAGTDNFSVAEETPDMYM